MLGKSSTMIPKWINSVPSSKGGRAAPLYWRIVMYSVPSERSTHCVLDTLQTQNRWFHKSDGRLPYPSSAARCVSKLPLWLLLIGEMRSICQRLVGIRLYFITKDFQMSIGTCSCLKAFMVNSEWEASSHRWRGFLTSPIMVSK